jgi:ferredoxin-NADP reductase
MPTPETFEAEIVATQTLAPDVKSFVFARSDGRPFAFEPGQSINLVLPLDGGEIRRAYCLASPSSDSPRFEVAVTRVTNGPGSGFLCGLEAGAKLRAIGPQGFFSRQPTDPAPALFVATGTGVTPLRSMLLAALGSNSRVPLWLLLGSRHEEDILYREEFAELSRAHPNVRIELTLSRGQPAWTERRGYVQTHVPELWKALGALEEGEPHLYVCGLERMVKAVRELTRGPLEAPRTRVHSERYD